MASTKQKNWSRDEFLDLLDDEDIAVLWEKWALSPAAKESKEAREFRAAVEERSKTSLLQDVLSLRTPTLQMLRDVLTFLLHQNSALRTTGSHVVLEEEFDISPQQVNAALAWSATVLRRHAEATWENLTNRFVTEVVPLFQTIADYAAVRVSRRLENPVKAPLRMERGGSQILRKIATVHYDRDGLRACQEYGKQLHDFNKKLAPLRDRDVDASARDLLTKIWHLSREHDARLREDQEDVKRADRQSCSRSGLHLTDKDHEIWKRFVEDTLSLSDLEESDAVVDLLRMDLFRKRPQLYELWVLVAILGFMRRAGYKVEMLSLRTTDSGRVVWNLNYAKSETAVARLFRSSDRSEYFLFYQLFRPGTSRNDMPDVALMPSDRAGGQPIWIMDPKHSERGGYALGDYEEVGLRYQRTFAPQRTWIVEYFPRPDIRTDNPLSFAANVELIRDVSPGGAGYACLLARLQEFHGCPAIATMAVVDVSGSFASNLQSVKDDLRRLAAEGIVLSDDIVWFADRAVCTSGCLKALEEDTLRPPPDLGGGTRFGPTVDLLEGVYRDASPGYSLRIYTDRRFDDISMDAALERLRRHGDVEVIDFQ